MPAAIIRDMTWVFIDYVRFLIKSTSPGYARIQSAWLFPDGVEVNRRLWVRVPVVKGLSRAYSATEMETELWIDAARGVAAGTMDGDLTSIRIDRFPFDEPIDLKHSFTIVGADQNFCGRHKYPVNNILADMVPDRAVPWRGNLLVFKHGKTAKKPIINIDDNDSALVEAIIKRVLRDDLIGEEARNATDDRAYEFWDGCYMSEASPIGTPTLYFTHQMSLQFHIYCDGRAVHLNRDYAQNGLVGLDLSNSQFESTSYLSDTGLLKRRELTHEWVTNMTHTRSKAVRPARRPAVHKFRDAFLSNDFLRRYTLTYLCLVDLMKYCHLSPRSRADVHSLLRGRILRYTRPFFVSDLDHTVFFNALEDRRAWVVGSVVLAILSLLSDPAVPDNLNVNTSGVTENCWVNTMVSVLKYDMVDYGCCKGNYLETGRTFMRFVHCKIPGRSITITTSRKLEIFDLFFRQPSTLMMNALSAQELVSIYVRMTSSQEGTFAWNEVPHRCIPIGPVVVPGTPRRPVRAAPVSPFPDTVTLHPSTRLWPVACGTACPAIPRFARGLKGIGHWQWGGFDGLDWETDKNVQALSKADFKWRTGDRCMNGNCPRNSYASPITFLTLTANQILRPDYRHSLRPLFQSLTSLVKYASYDLRSNMASTDEIQQWPAPLSADETPLWPTSLCDISDVLDFISDPVQPALTHDNFLVDFHPPVYGSYARDETAYTCDDGTPYKTWIFGRISRPVTWDDCHRRFWIENGGEGTARVTRAFSAQISELARPVKHDDDLDCDADQDTAVHAWTNAERLDMSGGCWIEIHVDHASTQSCTVHRQLSDESIELTASIHRNVASYPLKMGDWVLIQATLHKREDRCGWFLRDYEILARHVRVLRLDGNDVSPETKSVEASIPHAFADAASTDRGSSEVIENTEPAPKTPKIRKTARMSTGGRHPKPMMDLREDGTSISTDTLSGTGTEGSAGEDAAPGDPMIVGFMDVIDPGSEPQKRRRSERNRVSEPVSKKQKRRDGMRS
ncbi:hypothetical protein C8R44DRAFT_893570 [Mycena epipterygia]|nr:hypothetical protein C8R44DRAFT_893570 [Mycena epipterygia]